MAKPLRIDFAAAFWFASVLLGQSQVFNFSTLAGSPLEPAYVDGTNGQARFNFPSHPKDRPCGV